MSTDCVGGGSGSSSTFRPSRGKLYGCYRWELGRLLLARGADLNAQEEGGRAPLPLIPSFSLAFSTFSKENSGTENSGTWPWIQN
jgi:hypothetical protein